MPERSTTLRPLRVDTFPQFRRNKPRNAELYGYPKGFPRSGDNASHMLILSGPWHDQYARRVDQRITHPGYGDPELTEEQIASIQQLSDQIKCVAALIGIVEKGPGVKKIVLGEGITPTTLTQFVIENPHFYVTAPKARQDGKDPRYVAKLEEIVARGYKFGTSKTSVEAIVSDTEGNRGTFPRNTKDWRLAHLATTSMIDLPHDFRYLNNGYR